MGRRAAEGKSDKITGQLMMDFILFFYIKAIHTLRICFQVDEMQCIYSDIYLRELIEYVYLRIVS